VTRMEQYIVPALIGLIGVVAGALITSASQRKKIKSAASLDEAAINEQIRLTCVGLIEPLQAQINDLKIELQDWKDCADARAAQLRKHDITPAPFKSSKKIDAHVT
jgi:hypothetical protein